MKRTIFECDSCKKETASMVIFDATEQNLDERALYCQTCAVEEFAKWAAQKLSNGNNVLILTGGLVKAK